jgi:hypothetical protein
MARESKFSNRRGEDERQRRREASRPTSERAGPNASERLWAFTEVAGRTLPLVSALRQNRESPPSVAPAKRGSHSPHSLGIQWLRRSRQRKVVQIL